MAAKLHDVIAHKIDELRDDLVEIMLRFDVSPRYVEHYVRAYRRPASIEHIRGRVFPNRPPMFVIVSNQRLEPQETTTIGGLDETVRDLLDTFARLTVS